MRDGGREPDRWPAGRSSACDPGGEMAEPAVPSHTDVIVVRQRPGPALAPGDLVTERRPLREPGPGEVIVRNIVTSVDPYQLRMPAARLRSPRWPSATRTGQQRRRRRPLARPSRPARHAGRHLHRLAVRRHHHRRPGRGRDRAPGAPLDWISVLSTTGVTAYIGINDIGHVQAGQTVRSARRPAPSAGSPSSWQRQPAHASSPSRAARTGSRTPPRCSAPTPRSTTGTPVSGRG